MIPNNDIIIDSNKSLSDKILFLERRKQSELDLLKEHFEFTKEELNPLHVLKEGFKETVSSDEFGSKLIKGAASLATGFIANKFLLGPLNSPLKKIVATALQTGVSGLMMKTPQIHMDKLANLKDTGISKVQHFLNKIKIK